MTRAPTKGIFYGWIVVAGTFAVLMTAYGIQFTFGVFLPEIQEDTGWTRETLSRAFAFYVFLYGILGIVTGSAVDRFGPRPVIALGGLLLGFGYFSLSRTEEIWELYLYLSVVAAAGMSAAFVPCNSTVIRWFERYRGRALGIAMMGASIGNIAFPPLAVLLIGLAGWRAAYAWLGALGVSIVGVAAYFILRDPGVMNLQPDGAVPDGEGAGEGGAAEGARVPPRRGGPVATRYPWTLAEARRTGVLWLMTAIFFLSWLVVFLPVVHLAPYAADLGMDPLRASSVISAIGLGGVLGRPLLGAISDRVGRIPAMLLTFGTQALVFTLFPISHSWVALCLEATAFGFAYGGGTTLFAAVVGDYYGRAATGAIVGFVFALAGSAAAFGPWLAGYAIDTTGSYDLAFWFGAVTNGAACALVLFLRPPAPPVGASHAGAGSAPGEVL